MNKSRELIKRAKHMDVSVKELKYLDKVYQKYGDPAIYFIAGTVLTSKGRMLPHDYYINVANGYDVKLISPHINGTNKRIKVPSGKAQARRFANACLKSRTSNSEAENKDGKWNKLLHPRVPKGTSKGGQFTSNGSICSLEHFNSLSLEEKKAMIQEIMTSYNSFSRRKGNKGIKNSVTQRLALGLGLTKPPQMVIDDIDEFNRLLESGDYIPLFRTVTTNDNMTCDEMARRFMYDDEVPMNYRGGTTEGDGFYFSDELGGSEWYAGRVAKDVRTDGGVFMICALLPWRCNITEYSDEVLDDVKSEFIDSDDVDEYEKINMSKREQEFLIGAKKSQVFIKMAEAVAESINKSEFAKKHLNKKITKEELINNLSRSSDTIERYLPLGEGGFNLVFLDFFRKSIDYLKDYIIDISKLHNGGIVASTGKFYPNELAEEICSFLGLKSLLGVKKEIFGISDEEANKSDRMVEKVKEKYKAIFREGPGDVLGIDRHRNLYLKKQGIDESINTLRGMSPFLLLQGYKGHYREMRSQSYYTIYDRQPLICFSGNLFDENVRSKLKLKKEYR